MKKFSFNDPAYAPPIKLLCGATAHFDEASGISYRCDQCMAVVGSISMPKECKELYDMEKVMERLSGKKVVAR